MSRMCGLQLDNGLKQLFRNYGSNDLHNVKELASGDELRNCVVRD